MMTIRKHMEAFAAPRSSRITIFQTHSHSRPIQRTLQTLMAKRANRGPSLPSPEVIPSYASMAMEAFIVTNTKKMYSVTTQLESLPIPGTLNGDHHSGWIVQTPPSENQWRCTTEPQFQHCTQRRVRLETLA